MYRCKECQTPLTEFDVAFNEQLYSNNFNLDDCRCYHCITKGQVFDSIQELNKRKRLSKLLLGAFISMVMIPIALFILMEVPETNPLHPLMCITTTVCFIYLVYCVYEIFHLFERQPTSSNDDSPTGYHYESTIRNDGVIETRKVEEYDVSFDLIGMLLSICLHIVVYVSFPIWFLPYCLYNTIKIDSTLPSKIPFEILYAYNFADKQTFQYKIPIKKFKNYINEIKRYENNIDRIKSKYRDDSYVKNQINNIDPPVIIVNIQNQKYFLAYANVPRFGPIDRKVTTLLLYKNNHGILKSIIIQNNYAIYSTDEELKADYLKRYHQITPDYLNKFNRLKNYL